MNAKMILTAAVFAAILFTGCAKDGDPGAAGPAGADGNANVMVKTITVSTWTAVGSTWTATINDADITADIVIDGLVPVYINTVNGFSALPYVVYPSSNYFRTYSAMVDPGVITIKIQDSDLILPGNPGAITFKYAIISGFLLL